MRKKELVVRDLIRKLLEFNMDAKIEINITGVQFYLNSDFSLCWDNGGDSHDSYKERKDRPEATQTAKDATYDITT